MIALLLGLSLAAPVTFDRVDVLSDTSGTWLHDEVERIDTSPQIVGVRFLEQIQPVIAYQGVQLGLSLRTQSLRYERSLGAGPLLLNGGVQFSAGLPNGLILGVARWRGPVRVGASLSALSAASWARPEWNGWRWLPTVCIGFGPKRAAPTQKAPWM